MAENQDRPAVRAKTGRQNPEKVKSIKSKIQKVYVRLTETIPANADLAAFLQHRMSPKVIPFEIIEDPRTGIKTKDETLSSKIVLMFQSKSAAVKAVNCLHASNTHTNSKVHCFFTVEEEKELTVESKAVVDDKFERHMKEIYEAAKLVLDSHGKKIREAKENLSVIEKTLGQQRDLSLEEHDKLLTEQGAREDKFNELTLQQKEFKLFLTSLKNKLENVKYDPKYDIKIQALRKNLGIECNRLKCALPMYARRSDILDVVEKHQVCVILGETGSGKSTQMAQYIYQAGFARKGMIACTQPRKIAAISLATHVASELASSVGQIVGYQVGMQKKKTGVTKVLYMTDHVLLNECLKDNSLTEFSCLIIDEAHERSIYTDLLLGMIKSCLQKRSDLKVIVTSATIDPGVFVKYFGGVEICPVLKVSGRTFPVTVFYNEEDEEQPFPELYEEKAINKAIEIHTQFPLTDGDILVFLTSPLETEKSCEKFESNVPGKNYKCMQLHGKLQAGEQKQVFDPPPLGCRKIVFATNSAETSITIPGIKFVIDTGLAKEMRYDPKKNMNSLSMYPISRSSAEQRKGRAGRVAPGKCYRLFAEKDYNEMETNTKPEILRVHLGQALLKLLELGVNPLEFDFVESPPKASLQTAMESLEEIKAVKDNIITDLGRWIAKLPLEPRLGVLVKKGIDKNLPIEAMVLAACCGSSGLFFRMGTEEEKKIADVLKTKFCHPGGDLLTMLNVFRDWHNLGEKEKGKWCKDNSINGKAIKGIRETINEVLTVLRREMKEDIKFILRPKDEVDQLLQGLVIECMRNNVCCFLGHEQAGYITKKQLQHVQIHPSSSMKSLGQTPKLLVYWQLLQTSRNFVTNLTPVDEELLERLEFGFSLDVNEEEIEKKYVSLAEKIPMGNTVFKRFVGPMHRNRREKENEIQQMCENSVIIIEAKRELGEIQLFCNQRFSETAKMYLHAQVQKLTEPYRKQTLEVHLGKSKAESGTRAVLGAGGEVKEILMPHQFRHVKIKVNENKEMSESDIQNLLAPFGEIQDLIRFKKKTPTSGVFWGRVTYLDQKAADKAVQFYRENKESVIKLVPETYGREMCKGTNFTLKLTWVRRLSKGFGYVNLQRPEDLPAILFHKQMYVNGRLVSISQSKKGDNLYLKGLEPYVTEEAVCQALAALLCVEPDKTRFQVIIPRSEAAGIAEEPSRVIKREIEKHVPEHSFKVTMPDIKPTTVRGTAFVRFSEADHFHVATNALSQGSPLYLNGNPANVTVDLKSSIQCTKHVYEAIKEDIDAFIDEAKNTIPKAKFTVKEVKLGNVFIEIYASSTADMASAKVAIHKIVDGDHLEYERNAIIAKLFTHDAREYLKMVQEELKSVVTLDHRTMNVRVQGSSQSKTLTFLRINEYLGKMAAASEKEVLLKGKGNPVGLMKALLIRFGTDLETMRTECGLLSVILKHRYHSIILTGENEAIEKATTLIEEIKAKLVDRDPERPCDDSLPECPICLCEIDLPDLVRLEFCGHSYCQSCLKSQILSGIQDRQFPIVCAVENCNSPIVHQDIKQQIEKKTFDMKSLAAAAVSSFVGKNQKSFRYCITPDCEMVYRVSEDGRLFQCCDCATQVCTTCHLQYHDGLTCEMYQHVKSGEGNVELWIKEKPEIRKKCPKCQIGIEKDGGCNHMTCAACRSHICWVCLQFFSTQGECYGHLNTNHGSFV